MIFNVLIDTVLKGEGNREMESKTKQTIYDEGLFIKK